MARVARDRVLLVDTLYMGERRGGGRAAARPHARPQLHRGEWRSVFVEAGLRSSGVERFEKPIDSRAWLERAGCEGEEAERVRELLADRDRGRRATLDKIALRAAKVS